MELSGSSISGVTTNEKWLILNDDLEFVFLDLGEICKSSELQKYARTDISYEFYFFLIDFFLLLPYSYLYRALACPSTKERRKTWDKNLKKLWIISVPDITQK